MVPRSELGIPRRMQDDSSLAVTDLKSDMTFAQNSTYMQQTNVRNERIKRLLLLDYPNQHLRHL